MRDLHIWFSSAMREEKRRRRQLGLRLGAKAQLAADIHFSYYPRRRLCARIEHRVTKNGNYIPWLQGTSSIIRHCSNLPYI
jgi:hypothetical protein